MADIKYDINVSVQNAMQALDRFNNKVQEVNNNFSNITAGIGNFATVAGAALVGLATSAAAFADQMSDVAAANETSIATVLGLTNALAGAGGSADSVGRMFQALSNNIDSANGGNMKMVDTFRRLGVTIDDLATTSGDQIRNNLIKAIAGIQDPTERAAKAQEVFGKAAMGVDFVQLAANIDEQTAKYAEYEEQIKTAGAAFDSMGQLIRDIKVAAAIAFEPLFKYIADLKVDIPTLTTYIKAFAVALAAAVSVSVLAGFAKLLSILKDINTVVSKNKLITIAAAVLSAGAAVATWTGLLKDTEEAQESVNKKVDEAAPKVEKVKRDQTGLTDAIQKQKDTLSQVTENYNRQLSNIKDKLAFEEKSLTMSEAEKRLAQEQSNIEQNSQTALANLKQKYDAMDATTRAARKGDYEKERQLIEANTEAAKKDAETRLASITQYKNQLKELTSAIGTLNQANQDQFQQIANNMIKDADSAAERIDLEQKMAALVKLRTSMTQGLVGLNEEEQQLAAQAINTATTRIQMLSNGYDNMNMSVNSFIDGMLKIGAITPKIADAIKNSNALSRNSIMESAREMSDVAKQYDETTKQFSYGWNKAFIEYANNATNAALQARTIFQTFTSSLEDNLTKSLAKGKLLYKEFLLDIVQQLIRSNIRSLMTQIFSGGSGASKLNSTGSFFQSLLGFANGGIIPTNSPVVVGERGPELLVGASGNRVIPNNQLGGASVTYNINAVDAMSFKSMLAADPSFLYAVTEQGRRRLPGVA